MIDSRLFTELFQIFPEAFSINREYVKYKYETTPWGIEKIEAGTSTETLAEDILMTAQAMCKGDLQRSIKYLQVFKKKAVQKQEIKNFTKQ